jgi:hypothetical protein
MFNKRVITALGCGAAGSIMFVASAPATTSRVATHPKPGTYAQEKDSRFLMEFTLAHHKIKRPIRYDHCVKVRIEVPDIKVTSGRFSYDGKDKDVLSNKFKVHVDGKFTSRTTAKGNWHVKQLSGGSCSSDFDYQVKRTGAVGG